MKRHSQTTQFMAPGSFLDLVSSLVQGLWMTIIVVCTVAGVAIVGLVTMGH